MRSKRTYQKEEIDEKQLETLNAINHTHHSGYYIYFANATEHNFPNVIRQVRRG